MPGKSRRKAAQKGPPPPDGKTRKHGLYNQGSTCYLNSVLQVLFMTQEFRKALERSSAPDTMDQHLLTLFKDLEKRTASTTEIIKTLQIKVNQQRDAAEYLEQILMRTSAKSSKIFEGELTAKCRCLTCENESRTTQPFWSLPIPLVVSGINDCKVVDGIEEYFKESLITGEDQLDCNNCKYKTNSAFKLAMTHHPEVLTLLLKRFHFDNSNRMYIKNQQSVEVPFRLTVEEKYDYELYAFVEHNGTLRSGHYTVKIKSQDDEKWYYFNDDHVGLMDFQPFQVDNSERSCYVYLLFYRKIHTGNTESSPSSVFNEKTETNRNVVETEEQKEDKVLGEKDSCVKEKKHEVERQRHYVSVDGRETQDETGQSLTKDDVNKAERKENHPGTVVNNTGEKYNNTERKWDNREMKDTGGEESSNKVEKQSEREKHLMENHNDKEISDGGDEGRRNNLNEQSDEGKALDHNKVDSDWKAPDVEGYGGDKGLNAQEGETSHSISQKDEEIKLRPGKRNDEADYLETGFPETKKKKKESEAETDDVSTTRNHGMVSSFSSLKGSSPGVKYYGLYRQGATSYLNSVLQVLFMTKDFREALERSRSRRDDQCLDAGLLSLFDDLQKATTETDSMTRLLGITDVFVQSDAADCFEKIMGSLSSSEASQIFQGKLKHINKCLTCKKETSSDSPFWNLPLELDEKQYLTFSVVDSIKEFFREFYFTGPDQIFCQHCQKKSNAAGKCEMVHPPQVLTLMLKRFKFVNRYKVVINNQSVKFPSRLTVEEKHDYELYAFVEHGFGHYTVKIKSQDDEKWYYFKDAHVRLMDFQPFQMNNSERSYDVYLLFYRKIHTENTEPYPSSAFNEETETITNAVKTEEHEEDQVSLDNVSDRQQTQDETGNVEKKGIDDKGEERLNLMKDYESKADKKENTLVNNTGDKYNNVIEEAESQGENNVDQQCDRNKHLKEKQISDGGDQGRCNNMDEQSDEGKDLYHNMVKDSVVKAAAEKQRLSENPKVLQKNTLWNTQTPSTRSEENSKSPQDETADQRNHKGDQSLNEEEGKMFDSQSVDGNDEGPKDPRDDLKQKEGEREQFLSALCGSTELSETKRSDTEKTQGPVRNLSEFKIPPQTLAKLEASNINIKVVETKTSVNNLSESFKSLSLNDSPSSRVQGLTSISDPTQNKTHHTLINQTHTTRRSLSTIGDGLYQMSQSGSTPDPVVLTTGPPLHPPKTTIN
ncbi:uncharacterized protein LOC114480055 isoform X2 [Gouania willdenowi]|uniref:uncharacterized protein LOC114480055 isoform X2 n=2 Tax=Gouania willdenowi TaxID=441366 RepID=UPI001055964B|nr:uncharacterized protein LOC114480055 isoform X2 [Gouania willdenowi]